MTNKKLREWTFSDSGGDYFYVEGPKPEEGQFAEVPFKVIEKSYADNLEIKLEEAIKTLEFIKNEYSFYVGGVERSQFVHQPEYSYLKHIGEQVKKTLERLGIT